jgi:K+ transporter
MEQKAKEVASHAAIPVSISAMLVTLGVVYGDIGTSPMYVTKALVAGNGGIGSVTQEFVLGALSLVVWTVTLLTTVKYVLISLRADNHGEGGIFALYSLVKRCGKWLIIPAMLGGAALLADGILPLPSPRPSRACAPSRRSMPCSVTTRVVSSPSRLPSSSRSSWCSASARPRSVTPSAPS